MKIKPSFDAFKISSKGMSIQKKKMDLITENIANSNTTMTSEGIPYQRKTLKVSQQNGFLNSLKNIGSQLKLKASKSGHIKQPSMNVLGENEKNYGPKGEVIKDAGEGELVFLPDHPDANDDGYVLMPNVNVITEMVDMIAATRSFEANVEAFNASKQIAKNSLEI